MAGTHAQSAIPSRPESSASSASTIIQPASELSKEAAELDQHATNHTIDHLQNASLAREIAIIAIIASSQLFTQTGLALAIAPIIEIGQTFRTDNPGNLSWLPAAFSLTVGTFILPSGRWGDVLGYKRVFVVGYAWFAVWSAVAGFAAFSHNLIFFTWARAMQGIGPALLLPNGVAMLTHIYPPGGKRAMAVSIFGGVAPGGFLVGAVLSGLFTQFVWWPWTYWVTAIILAVLCLASLLVLPDVRGTGLKAVAELDLEGSFLGVLALIFINFAFNEGPAAGWDKVFVYVLLIVGAAVLGVFVWYETHCAKHPLLPSAALTLVTGLVLLTIALGWASFGIWIYYLWQVYILRGDTILLRAAEQTPTMVSGLVAAVVSGRLLRRVNAGLVLMISMCAFCVGAILIATVPVTRLYWKQIFFATLVTPWGMDMSFPAGCLILSAHVRKEYQGMAASLVNTVVNYSISIGLGFAGTIESHVNDGGADLLKGYRGALYFGIGVSGLAIGTAAVLTWIVHREKQAHDRAEVEHGAEIR
ncbi:hypothetical protein KEM52_003797 [Ascosphaera acerosa]|nr:hypothetical protein KEM52_003797 [Ascosphaera acerosa]